MLSCGDLDAICGIKKRSVFIKQPVSHKGFSASGFLRGVCVKKKRSVALSKLIRIAGSCGKKNGMNKGWRDPRYAQRKSFLLH